MLEGSIPDLRAPARWSLSHLPVHIHIFEPSTASDKSQRPRAFAKRMLLSPSHGGYAAVYQQFGPRLRHHGADFCGANFESYCDVVAGHFSERGKVW